MSKLKLNLLNVLPVRTRKHTPREIALAKAMARPLRTRMTYHNAIDMVKAILDEGGVGEASSAMTEALKTSSIYKYWQISMPCLKDVKNIHYYRLDKTNKFNLNEVDKEIITYGGYLTKGQILFRGGNFSGRVNAKTKAPISTSTNPSVARWHSIKVKGEIAILRISEPNAVMAFAFKTYGYQRHTGEFEVLLQKYIKLKFQRSFWHKKIRVIIFDVHGT